MKVIGGYIFDLKTITSLCVAGMVFWNKTVTYKQISYLSYNSSLIFGM